MNNAVRTLIAALLSIPVTVAVTVAVIGGGLSGLNEAFRSGGFYMLVVTAALLVQGALVVIANVVDKDDPAPLALYLFGPLIVVGSGAMGYWSGHTKIHAALFGFGGADRFVLFFAGASEAAQTLIYGLAGGGLGLLSVAALGALNLLGGSSRGDAHKASGALLFLVGGTLGAWAFGRALVELARAEVYQGYAALEAREAKVAWVQDALDQAAARQLGMHLATGLVFLLGLTLLVAQRKHMGALLAVRRLGTLGGAVVAAAGVLFTGFALGADERSYAELVEVDDLTRQDLTRGAPGPLPRAPGLPQQSADGVRVVPVTAGAAPDLPTTLDAEERVVLAAGPDTPARDVVAWLQRIEAARPADAPPGASAGRVGVLLEPDDLGLDPDRLAAAGVFPYRAGTRWLVMPVTPSPGDVGVLVDERSGSLQQLIVNWPARGRRGEMFLTTDPALAGTAFQQGAALDADERVLDDRAKRERDRKIAFDALKALGLTPDEGRANGLGPGINNALGGLGGAHLGDVGGGQLGLGAPRGSMGSRGGDLGIGGRGRGTGGQNANAQKRAARVRAGKVTFKGALRREEIERAVRRVNAQLRFCYEKELAKTPALAGKIALEFVIGGTGNVSSAKAAQNTLPVGAGQKVESCSLRIIRRLRFPKPRGGGQVFVTYPFVYSRAD